jgi:hypothetical protein
MLRKHNTIDLRVNSLEKEMLGQLPKKLIVSKAMLAMNIRQSVS